MTPAPNDAIVTEGECEDEGCPHYGKPHGHSTTPNDAAVNAERLVGELRALARALPNRGFHNDWVKAVLRAADYIANQPRRLRGESSE